MSSDQNANIGAYAGAGGPELASGMDRFLKTQQPDPDTSGDPLAAFVIARVRELELEPRGEVDPFKNPEHAMAYRYAKHVRNDCVVFRKQVVQYMEIKAALAASTDPGENRLLAGCMLAATGMLTAIAERWSDHYSFQAEWGIE